MRVKKSPRRKSQLVAEEKAPFGEGESNFSQSKPPLLSTIAQRVKSRRFLTLFLIIVFALLIYSFKNQFLVATVNGEPIWRLTLIRELEKEGGKRTLDALVAKTLVLQEAKKKSVVVSSEELNQELKNMEEVLVQQGQNMDQLLAAQEMTRQDLAEQVRLQKLVEKLLGKEIEVSDEEVRDYFEKNKSMMPKDAKLEDFQEEIKRNLRQEKMNEKIQSWMRALQENAKINYFLKF